MTNCVSAPMRVVLMAGALLVGLSGTSTVCGQVRDTISRDADAELMFEQGVSAFERGDYEKAAERFRLVKDYPLNHKTTAALVMQGKALLRLGRYQEAVDVLETFLDRYPQTSYKKDAQRVLDAARQGLDQSGAQPDTLRVGVALPMTDKFVALS